MACSMGLVTPHRLFVQASGCANGAGIDLSQYPVPVTPIVGGKDVEVERAKIAECAMKSGAAITEKNILFQDEWLVIVDKPAGFYSEHVLVSVPTLLGHPYSSKYPIQDDAGVLPHLHLANRLDRDTSGVLVVTKSKQAAGKLSQLFERGEVNKSYVALCTGALPRWKSAKVVSGHGRSRHGCWRVYSNNDVGKALPTKGTVKKMVTRVNVIGLSQKSDFALPVADNDNEVEEEIITVEGIYEESVLSDCTDLGREVEIIVRAFPQTGRTHQIRMHCQYLGIPLKGDVKYGGSLFWEGERLNSHYLHAESMSFLHPVTGDKLNVVASPPSWFPQQEIFVD